MSGRLMPRMVVTMGSDVRERRKATCRHCGVCLEETVAQWATVVTQLPAGWMSAEDGTFACIPAEYGRDVVPHVPMPAGFRGAPE